MVKAIIFDFDGTIVDSLAAVIRVLEQFTGAKKPMSESEVEKLENMSMWQIAKTMRVPFWKLPAVAMFGRKLFHGHMRSVRVHPGMAELIKELNGKVKLYILSTNRRANIEKYLTWHDLDTFFTQIYGGASFLNKRGKLRELLIKEKLLASEVWSVGDEIVDIEAAKSLGVKVASVAWGFSGVDGLDSRQPQALVQSVDELRELLLKEIGEMAEVPRSKRSFGRRVLDKGKRIIRGR